MPGRYIKVPKTEWIWIVSFFIAWVEARVTFSFASLNNPCLRFIYSSCHFQHRRGRIAHLNYLKTRGIVGDKLLI